MSQELTPAKEEITARITQARERITRLLEHALDTVEDLMGSQDDRVRLAAAQDIMNRAGLIAPTRVEMDISVEQVDSDIDRLLVKLMAPQPSFELNDVIDIPEEDVEEEEDIAAYVPPPTVRFMVPRAS